MSAAISQRMWSSHACALVFGSLLAWGVSPLCLSAAAAALPTSSTTSPLLYNSDFQDPWSLGMDSMGNAFFGVGDITRSQPTHTRAHMHAQSSGPLSQASSHAPCGSCAVSLRGFVVVCGCCSGGCALWCVVCLFLFFSFLYPFLFCPFLPVVLQPSCARLCRPPAWRRETGVRATTGASWPC